jgi:anti-sigma-K factor RskA
MTDDDRDNLLLYAAGALSDDEAAPLRKKLTAGSPEEIGALAQAQALLALLPLALPPAAPSADVKERLLKTLPPQFPTMKLLKQPKSAVDAKQNAHWPLLLTAAAAVFIITICLSMVFSSRRDAHNFKARWKEAENQLALAKTELVTQALSLQTAQNKLASMNDMLGADQLQLVGLAMPQPSDTQKCRGRILWDKEKKQWLVAVYDLMPPAQGRSYELWFITPDQKKVPAMVFNTNGDGHAMMHVNLPATVPLIAVAAITDEPSAGSAQPTGSIHLVANLK